MLLHNITPHIEDMSADEKTNTKTMNKVIYISNVCFIYLGLDVDFLQSANQAEGEGGGVQEIILYG